MPQSLPPKFVLVVDDNEDLYGSYAYHSELKKPEDDLCNGKYFTDVESAIAYLETLDPLEFPEVLIVDCMPPTEGDIGNPFLGSFWQASRCGDIYARNIIDVYREKGARLPHILFKSADENIVRETLEDFVGLYSDVSCGTMVPNPARSSLSNFFTIKWDRYVSPQIPDLVGAFVKAYQRGENNEYYEALREHVAPLLEAWDGLSEVKAGEEAPYSFQHGFGPVCKGQVVRNLDELSGLPKGEKAVLVTQDFSQEQFVRLIELLRVSPDRVSALVITEDFEMPGHLWVALRARNLALLAGCEGEAQFATSQIVTLSPAQRRLWSGDLEILSAEAVAPVITNAIADATWCANQERARGSAVIPEFSANVSGDADLRQAREEDKRIGLLRSEQFIGPYVNPDAWEAMKDFLIGEGQRLREGFARVAGAPPEQEEYAAVLDRLWKNFNSHNTLESTDVFRLFDIPAEEFLDGDDLQRFQESFGTDVRGVQLARQIPDLYIAQINALCWRFSCNDRCPNILIPAVKTGEDVSFVRDLLKKHAAGMSVSLGAMIETREACANIEGVAQNASFISFGTNDLGAAVLGVPRNDRDYQSLHMRRLAPEVLDVIAATVSRAQNANPYIHISLCGEAARDLQSLIALRDRGVWIDSFSVDPEFRNTALLPLAYQDHVIQNFCGPLRPVPE